MALRGYLAAFVNMCWGMGLLLSAGVVRASLRVDSAWGWRVPFMLQWIWPVPLLILAYFAPESKYNQPSFLSVADVRRSLVACQSRKD